MITEWRFNYSYKHMFWYTLNTDKLIITVCISGDLYRNEMQPLYAYNEFFNEFICDNEIDIDEVD